MIAKTEETKTKTKRKKKKKSFNGGHHSHSLLREPLQSEKRDGREGKKSNAIGFKNELCTLACYDVTLVNRQPIFK